MRSGDKIIFPPRKGGIFISKNKNRKKDAPVKRQMQKPHIFCDFVNGVLFDGQQRLLPEMLTRLPEGTVLALEGQEGEAFCLERVRDVAFEAAFPQENSMIFRVILGEENQSFVDYGMVIREMGYEAGGYGEQLKARRLKHRNDKDLKPGDEFLSGIQKEECFVPIVNFVFYYGEKPWDGKTRLFDLLKVPEEEAWIYNYISDYRINLVHAENVHPGNFRTGLRQVFELLPFSGSGSEMERYVMENSAEFSNVSAETFDLLSTFFNDREMGLINKERFRNKEGGGYNMCTAFREIREDGVNQGIQIGKEQGIQIGEERVNLLIQHLIQDSRTDEIAKAVSDRAYQQELFLKYGI